MTRRIVILCVAVLAIGAIVWVSMLRSVAIEHGDRMALEAKLSDALNAPGGPDYPRVIALYRAADLNAERRTLDIATTTLNACRDKRPPCTENPPATEAAARAQLATLAKTATERDVRAAATRWTDAR